MTTVDQTIGDDWRDRHVDEYFEGRPAPKTTPEWEAEYAEFVDTEMFGGVNEAFEQVFGGVR